MNSVENLKIRLNNEGERITDLEAKTIEIIQSEEPKEKGRERSEESLWDLMGQNEKKQYLSYVNSRRQRE